MGAVDQIVSQTDLARYVELARLCRASYSGPIRHTKLDYLKAPFTNQVIIHGSFGRGFCRLFHNDQSVVVIFRGTREGVDWTISNLRCWPVRLKGVGSDDAPLVHRGFQEALYYLDKTSEGPALDAAFERLENLLTPGRQLIVTGHSLGGAIAVLFAVKFLLRYPALHDQLSEVVTFGAPAVGFDRFNDHIRKSGLKVTRVVNEYDGVPFTPPLFYRHVGREIWLSATELAIGAGWRTRFLLALARPLRLYFDHDMNSYIVNLCRHADLPLPRAIKAAIRKKAMPPKRQVEPVREQDLHRSGR